MNPAFAPLLIIGAIAMASSARGSRNNNDCKECGEGPLTPLGAMGSVHWYRCRACGADQVADPDWDEDGDEADPGWNEDEDDEIDAGY